MVLKNEREPHSATGAFFVSLKRAPWLDGRYTVVGKVINGMEVIEAMTRVPLDGNRPVEPIAIESAEVSGGS